MLLHEARQRYEKERSTGARFDYAQGYAEGLEKALTVGLAGLPSTIAEILEIIEFQAHLPETASPRRYRAGELDALRQAEALLGGGGEGRDRTAPGWPQ